MICKKKKLELILDLCKVLDSKDYNELDEYYGIFNYLLICVKHDLMNYGINVDEDVYPPNEYVYIWCNITKAILKEIEVL